MDDPQESWTVEQWQLNEHLQEEIVERKRAVAEREELVQHLVEANRSLEELSKQVQQSQCETEQILAAIAAILIGVEANGRIIRWNTQAEKVFGLQQADVLGRLLLSCPMTWDDAAIAQGLTHCRITGQPIRLDHIRFTRPDGTEGVLGLTISPIAGESHHSRGELILAQDVTERQRLEDQLAQSQKLEAIGQLAAGIAHEINTPIQYVSDNTAFLRDAFKNLCSLLEHYATLCQSAKTGTVSQHGADVVEALAEEMDITYLRHEIPAAIQQSLEGLDRVASIVQAMKEFAHPGGEDKVSIDLNKAIESAITVARHEWKYVAEMVTDLDPYLPMVPCLPGDISQVMLNLIVNAAHAIAAVVQTAPAAKGTITVRTCRVDRWVEIRVVDTGSGIPEAVRNKIFDPFFTTKEVGKGTGQGLALVHLMVVEKHAGSITFETEVGQGTTFIVRLPLEV